MGIERTLRVKYHSLTRWRLLDTFLLLVFGFSFVGCIQDIEKPYLGECADYPDGVYDYGDIGIGDCLAAPTDLQFYHTPDEDVLLVVNSNAYLAFSSGSVLPIAWDPLEAELDKVRAGFSQVSPDEDIVPAVFYTADLRDPSLAPGEYSAQIMPDFSGKMAIDTDRQMAFVSNRLSMTTNLSTSDHVYGVDLLDPLHLTSFDLVDGAAPLEDGADSFLVQDDP